MSDFFYEIYLFEDLETPIQIYEIVAYHAMLNLVSEISELIKAAISQFVKVVERYV